MLISSNNLRLVIACTACIFCLNISINTALAESCTFPATNTLPRLSIQHLNGTVQHDNTRSRESLMRMQQKNGQANAFGSEWIPVGLTLAELNYNMHIKVEAYQLPNRQFCARLSSVDATIGYNKINVYVARRFRPGTCAYHSITEHENTHVAVFRQTLADYMPRLRHRLTRATETIKPIISNSATQAAEYLRGRLSAATQPLYREMSRTLKRNNARLDTPERYRMEQARCKEW